MVVSFAFGLLCLSFVFTGAGVSSEDVYATEGSVVRLVCPNTARNGRMTWRGPPQLYPYSINTEKNLTIFLLNNLELIGNIESGEYSLVIQNFTSSHAGQYQCETVKNRAASRHLFNIFLQDVIIVNPSESLCKGSSGLLLECTLQIHNNSDWKNTWTHNFKGQTIRYLAAKPVFVDKSSFYQENFLIFEIRILSNPEPTAILWFQNNQIIDGQIKVNESLREAVVEITLDDKKVKTTGYVVYLKTQYVPGYRPTVFKCQIKNREGNINVSFDETYNPEFDGHMYSSSTMGNSSAKYETINSDIHGILKIYLSGAGCVILVGLSITALIIFRKKNAANVPTEQTVEVNLPGTSVRIISDTETEDRRRNLVKSYHEYEDVESISSSHSDQSHPHQAYENTTNDVMSNRCYINAVVPSVYVDLDHDTRTGLREYDQLV